MACCHSQSIIGDIIQPSTGQLVNLSTRQLVNLSTRQLVNLSTRQLYNISTIQMRPFSAYLLLERSGIANRHGADSFWLNPQIALDPI